ncbi:MAG: glycogen/starch synthase [Bacteroidales bacterium]|nr:glycogen/starch synthase [Bacteroidales bacterium]
MSKKQATPKFIFETSWEVCNKVGGIYTVLSTRAKTMTARYGDNVCFIGPDVCPSVNPSDFKEDKKLLPAWHKAADSVGISVRIGRWLVPGLPLAMLVDYAPLRPNVNAIYAEMWERGGIESQNGYDDYENAALFSYAAGRLVEAIVKNTLAPTDIVVYQAHEWMSAMGMLYLQSTTPQVATIFTTHATSVGRSITSNDKLLYKYFEHYNGAQMARELNVEAKHSNENQPAWLADCFTTVSDFTARECQQLFGKSVDVVLENGFEMDFVPTPKATFDKARHAARTQMLRVASAVLGKVLPEDTLIVSTSGRNDYRSKGFDVLFDSLATLRSDYRGERPILALVEVPCWVDAPRVDLQQRLKRKKPAETPLDAPYLTHTLHNFWEDRILNTMRSRQLTNEIDEASNVYTLLVPCYLDGKDGIFNTSYYDLLIGCDLCLYPSYYEPWGYTPLESIAFHIPTVTTDLSGFGQWVNKMLAHEGMLEDGVQVIHRTDDNYHEVVHTLKDTIALMASATPTVVATMRKQAAALAKKAVWSKFFKKYEQAYAVAIAKAQARLPKQAKDKQGSTPKATTKTTTTTPKGGKA